MNYCLFDLKVSLIFIKFKNIMRGYFCVSLVVSFIPHVEITLCLTNFWKFWNWTLYAPDIIYININMCVPMQLLCHNMNLEICNSKDSQPKDNTNNIFTYLITENFPNLLFKKDTNQRKIFFIIIFWKCSTLNKIILLTDNHVWCQWRNQDGCPKPSYTIRLSSPWSIAENFLIR